MRTTGLTRRTRRLLGLALIVPVLLATLPAHATPSAPPATAARDDVLSSFLQARGLVSAADGVRAARDRAAEMVVSAMTFLGVPYRRGGNDADTGFDCSGFTRYVFQHTVGMVLPRRAEDQARADGLVQVKRDELKPGDLVFFNTLRRTFSHVGIYVGDGKFIHAPRSGAEVRVEDMRVAYWSKRFNGARRAESDPSGPKP